MEMSRSAVYYTQPDAVAHDHMICVSDFAHIEIPHRSFEGSAYATVSSKPTSYIQDVLRNIFAHIHRDVLAFDIDSEMCHILQEINTTNKIVLRGPDGGNQRAHTAVLMNPVQRLDDKVRSQRTMFTTKTLRPSQFKALVYSLMPPLILILGCPGSGKSTTLAHIIKSLLLEKDAASKWVPVWIESRRLANEPK